MSFLNQMRTEEVPANLSKVIKMLGRKIKRRLVSRSRARETIYQLQIAIRRRNTELNRVRNNYKQLEEAFIRQHLRDARRIEQLRNFIIGRR